MAVGFIGTGSMGRMLIEAFIQAGSLAPEQMIIHNRTIEKAKQLTSLFPTIKIASSLEEIIQVCDTIFICVRPIDYKNVLEALHQLSSPQQTIISITSSIWIKDIEIYTPAKIIKMIPSITFTALSGPSLIMFSDRLNENEQQSWCQFFSAISNPIKIDEQKVRVSSDIASCGPAFISYLLDNFIKSAVKVTGISHDEAALLVKEMIVGYGKLISSGVFTLETLQERVCVPGGVTGVGLAVLEEELGPLFEHLFVKTHEKFNKDIAENKEWLIKE